MRVARTSSHQLYVSHIYVVLVVFLGQCFLYKCRPPSVLPSSKWSPLLPMFLNQLAASQKKAQTFFFVSSPTAPFPVSKNIVVCCQKQYHHRYPLERGELMKILTMLWKGGRRFRIFLWKKFPPPTYRRYCSQNVEKIFSCGAIAAQTFKKISPAALLQPKQWKKILLRRQCTQTLKKISPAALLQPKL